MDGNECNTVVACYLSQGVLNTGSGGQGVGCQGHVVLHLCRPILCHTWESGRAKQEGLWYYLRELDVEVAEAERVQRADWVCEAMNVIEGGRRSCDD